MANGADTMRMMKEQAKNGEPAPSVTEGHAIAQAHEQSSSDPIHGSLGPPKCEDDDFANEEQRLVNKMKNAKA